MGETESTSDATLCDEECGRPGDGIYTEDDEVHVLCFECAPLDYLIKWTQEEPDYRYGAILRMVHDQHGEYKLWFSDYENDLLEAASNTPVWAIRAAKLEGYRVECLHDHDPPERLQGEFNA